MQKDGPLNYGKTTRQACQPDQNINEAKTKAFTKKLTPKTLLSQEAVYSIKIQIFLKDFIKIKNVKTISI